MFCFATIIYLYDLHYRYTSVVTAGYLPVYKLSTILMAPFKVPIALIM